MFSPFYGIKDIINFLNFLQFLRCYHYRKQNFLPQEHLLPILLAFCRFPYLHRRQQQQELSKEDDVQENIDVLIQEKIFESRDAFYLIHMLDLYYTVDISRFTMDSFTLYMEGKVKKAIAKYNKSKDKLTKYEKRLLEYLKENEQFVEVIPENLNTFAQAKKLKNVKNDLLPMLISWIILTPIWCILYDLVFFIALQVLSKEAVYVGGADPFMIFLPAFITAIINSYFARKIVYKLFFKKNYNKMMALDEIENSERVEATMSKLFQFTIALGLVFSVLAANTNISFYEGNFKNNLEFFSIKGETISYADVNCVYKTDSIMNDFGYVLNNPTYVIVLNGGRQISLYYYMEFEDIEKNIVPIFEKNNIEMRKIDLENNIEKDLEKQM